jgi:hypothetical protein
MRTPQVLFSPYPEKGFAFLSSVQQCNVHGRSRNDMEERRLSPRIKFGRKKSGFFVKLIMKRFFFKEREIICMLRDLSEGGASLLVKEEYQKYITEKSIGTGVQLLSENPEISFRLHRKGRVIRVFSDDNGVTAVVLFSKSAG